MSKLIYDTDYKIIFNYLDYSKRSIRDAIGIAVGFDIPNDFINKSYLKDLISNLSEITGNIDRVNNFLKETENKLVNNSNDIEKNINAIRINKINLIK